MRRTLLRIAAVAALAAVASCDSSSPPQTGAGPAAPGAPAAGAKPFRFAFVTNNTSNFWNIANKGLEKARRDLGVEPIFRAPQNGKVAEQLQIIEDLLVQGVDGIAVSPLDPEGQRSLLNRAAAQVPLICHDSDAPDSNRLCYIGTHNYTAGREAGKAMKEILPTGGKIAVFVGRKDVQNAADRLKGFTDEIAGTSIEIVHEYLDHNDRAKAKQNPEDSLTTYPDLAAMLGLWAYNGPAIASAVKGAGKAGNVKIVCFDEDDATLAAVKDGVIYATVVQKPFEFGYQSMKVLKAVKEGRAAEAIPANKVIDTGVVVVKKSNVDAFSAELKAMKE